MKKIIAVIAVAIMTTAFGATTAFAHGHQGGKTAAYTVCTVESCVKTGRHIHSGVYYAAHYYGDSHNYHDYCAVADCTLAGYHEHDGAYCFSHTANDGHNHNFATGKHRCR
jgi:hypothetical protein